MAHSQYQAYAAYGSLNPQNLEAATSTGEASAIVKPPALGLGRSRMRMNVIAICVSLFAPWLLFVLTFADLSFHIHFKDPFDCWLLVVCAFAVTLGFGYLAGNNVKLLYQASESYRPTWFIFLFLTSLAAVVMGTVLGNKNFWENMDPYYNLKNLNAYTSVDPSRMRGEQMMDAGQVEFLPEVMLDLSKAYAFQNQDTYCVAPMTMYNKQLGGATPLNSYDFWAVGKNCCGGDSANAVDFNCGKFGNYSHEGLRLMADGERSFFRLAVQQAEAAHAIKSIHPLFFYVTSDSKTMMNTYLEDAFRMFASWMCGLFLLQLCLVTIVSHIVSSAGHNNC